MTFDYMEAFMMETFRSYGVSEEEATIATDLLLEADKRFDTQMAAARDPIAVGSQLIANSPFHSGA